MICDLLPQSHIDVNISKSSIHLEGKRRTEDAHWIVVNISTSKNIEGKEGRKMPIVIDVNITTSSIYLEGKVGRKMPTGGRPRHYGQLVFSLIYLKLSSSPALLSL